MLGSEYPPGGWLSCAEWRIVNACMYFSALSWELQETFVDAGALRES